eukprot:m.54986 g.54986  ORF g.54986 m.54986 type:complete len:216 (-) comp11104_c0_seq2:116-763(-)
MKDIVVEDFDKEVEGSLTVVHFWAEWAPQCKQMDEAMKALEKKHGNVTFARVEAEAQADLTVKYNVGAVPTVLLFSKGKVIDTVEGANVPELTKKVASHATSLPPVEDPQKVLNDKLHNLIHSSPVMLFMKGSPEEPKCGFSRRMVELLNSAGATVFGHFNILADNEVRQGLKTYSDWPTYPQLYISGELVGGLDIAKELKESGELATMLKDALQ